VGFCTAQCLGRKACLTFSAAGLRLAIDTPQSHSSHREGGAAEGGSCTQLVVVYLDGDGSGDASVPDAGEVVRTQNFATDARARPGKTPLRTALSPRYGLYSFTKFGVNGFTKSLRQEVTRRHVRVGVLEPGGVATELGSHNKPEVRNQMIDPFYQQTEVLAPEDIADECRLHGHLPPPNRHRRAVDHAQRPGLTASAARPRRATIDGPSTELTSKG